MLSDEKRKTNLKSKFPSLSSQCECSSRTWIWLRRTREINGGRHHQGDHPQQSSGAASVVASLDLIGDFLQRREEWWAWGGGHWVRPGQFPGELPARRGKLESWRSLYPSGPCCLSSPVGFLCYITVVLCIISPGGDKKWETKNCKLSQLTLTTDPLHC